MAAWTFLISPQSSEGSLSLSELDEVTQNDSGASFWVNLDNDLLSQLLVSKVAVASCTPNTSVEADVSELCGFFFVSSTPPLVAGVRAQLPTSD